MTKKNYISPYDSDDITAIIDQLIEDYIIEDVSDSNDYDELETIINNAIKKFDKSIIENDEMDENEDMDYQDLKDDMFQFIQDAVQENYSKTIE